MLPIVTEATRDSLIQSIRGCGHKKTEEIFKEIGETQPILAETVRHQLHRMNEQESSEEYTQGFCQAAAIFYCLLKRQAEADEMNATFL